MIRVVGESRTANVFHNLGTERVPVEADKGIQVINGSIARYRNRRYLGALSSAIEVTS